MVGTVGGCEFIFKIYGFINKKVGDKMLIFAFIMASLTPVIVILGGMLLYKNSECEINSIFGYRTSRSMSSREAWIFSNKLCSKILLYGGIIADVISIGLVFLAYVISGHEAAFYTSIAANIAVAVMCIIVIPCVENKLKKFLAKENKNDKN